jgi:ferredoxin/flavodoxin
MDGDVQMKWDAVKLAFFSPTGTTRTVVEAIAKGIHSDKLEFTDVTRPEARKKGLITTENEVLVIGVPVYMGRVPALLEEWLYSIEAHHTPTVCVVVYGNRAYENALLELKNFMIERGGVPVASAAFIGEHSFSDLETPLAQGRPDANDLYTAETFGWKIREKLASTPGVLQISNVVVPGSYPYGGVTTLWDVDFIAVNDRCIHCGLCADECPMGAIDADDSGVIDRVKCITCCSCIKKCPQHARAMKPGPVKDAQQRLHTLFPEPKMPEYYL